MAAKPHTDPTLHPLPEKEQKKGNGKGKGKGKERGRDLWNIALSETLAEDEFPLNNNRCKCQ